MTWLRAAWLGSLAVTLGCGCSAGTADQRDVSTGTDTGGSDTGVGGQTASGGASDGSGGATAAVGGQPASGGNASGGTQSGSGGTGAFPPIDECNAASLDRLELWLISGEGTTVPSQANQSLLVDSGDGYVGRVEFVGNMWHVVPVRVANTLDCAVDLRASSGFELTYSATADFYVQLRPATYWNGGDKWLALVPSTGGAVETHFFSFDAAAWTTLPALGTPAYSVAEALSELRGLVFVGQTPNQIEFSGLRFDGYVPECSN